MIDDTIVIGTPDLPKIEVMYAFIATEECGEGICAAQTSIGWMPLVGADMARVDSLRKLAQQIATKTGRTIRLCKFSVREELESITP